MKVRRKDIYKKIKRLIKLLHITPCPRHFAARARETLSDIRWLIKFIGNIVYNAI